MRNFLGAISAVIIGTYLISATPAEPYPQPLSIMGFLLAGSTVLLDTLNVLMTERALMILATWIVMGLTMGIASDSKGNMMRTVMWTGFILSMASLIDLFALNPALWTADMVERNIAIVVRVIKGPLVALIGLIMALPTVTAINRFRRPEAAQLTPILTKCECGAVFKSRPVLCSECGRMIEYHIDAT